MNFGGLAIVIALMLFAPPPLSAQHDHSKGGETTAKPAPAKTTAKPALKPAQGASIKIVAPKPDQVFKGDSVPLEFKLTKGK
ncbi:MAG: hypothetical protein HYU46_23510 [Deltaproteobacteria bacterium]|nr:hypothetical protein [Deltaproteobacteria bacterium]MBI2533665.1 hypothetical protein [Deltaproteobacteria bacterium]